MAAIDRMPAVDRMSPVEAPGMRVWVAQAMHVASLRYFDLNGAFVRAVDGALGTPLPGVQCATQVRPTDGVNPAILAWRSPTETVLLSADDAPLAALLTHTAAVNDGCVVNQTDGMTVLRAGGEGIADLFARMGGQGVLPNAGETRRSRLANVPVQAMQGHPGEVLLLIERVYAAHVLGWIRAVIDRGPCARPGSPT